MGKSNSKLSTNELDDLLQCTHFNRKEIKQWYRGFLKDCPTGKMDRTAFLTLYKQFFPFGDPTEFSTFVFDVFDHDKNGSIDFKEFMCALSVASRGKTDEKLSWSFRLYDINNDGFISKEEMLNVIEAIYKMVGDAVKLPVDEDTPEKRLNKIFNLMDKNHDGRLSIDEFRDGSLKDPNIMQALTLYDGLV